MSERSNKKLTRVHEKLLAQLLPWSTEVMGSCERGQEWLLSPQLGIGGAVPVDRAETEEGMLAVANLLWRIDHGDGSSGLSDNQTATSDCRLTLLSLKVGSFVRILKVSASKSPVIESATIDRYLVGAENTKSLPVDYEMKGFLLAPIQVDDRIVLLRVQRNGVNAVGIFNSTTICDVCDDSTVETFNSIYQITRVGYGVE